MTPVVTAARRLRTQWVWLVPVPVLLATREGPHRVGLLLGAVVAAAALLAARRRPFPALVSVVVLLPFDTVLLALAYRLGLPGGAVRALGFWPEGLVAGAALSLLGLGRPGPRRRLDALDLAAIGFVVVGTAYLLVPDLWVTRGPGLGLTFYQRLLGWRSDVAYVLVFLLFRHARFTTDQRDRLFDLVGVVGIVVAAIGLLEFVAPGTFNHLAVHVFGVQRYKADILGQRPSPSFSPSDVRQYGTLGGHRFIRVASVLFDDLGVGFYLLPALAICAERLASGRPSTAAVAGLPLIATTILLTQTRSAIIAAAFAVALTLRRQIGRSIVSRLRLSLSLGAVVVVTLPLLLGSGLLHRFSGDAVSDSTHRGAASAGITAMERQPLGRGLSTAAGGGQLVAAHSTVDQTSGVLITESQYLQVGTQLGVAGLALYLAVVGLLVRHLRRGGGTGADVRALATAVAAAAIGVLFLQPFTDPEVSWTFWGVAGLAAGAADLVRPVPSDLSPLGVVGTLRSALNEVEPR